MDSECDQWTLHPTPTFDMLRYDSYTGQYHPIRIHENVITLMFNEDYCGKRAQFICRNSHF